MRFRHTRHLFLAITIAGLVCTAVASAAWLASGTGFAFTEASTVGAGNVPTASVSGQNVTVSWSATNFSGGGAVSGYTVKRYDQNDAQQTILSNCAGTVSGLSCTESSVPPGAWRYTITPKHSNWTGAESAKSATATVVPTCTSPGTQTVTANADTYLKEDVGPTNNFGTVTPVNVKSNPGQARRTLVRFPLPAVPSGCRLNAATLRLNASASPAGRTIHAYRAASSWVETTATWTNGPSTAGTPSSAASAVGWTQWNVASHVRTMYSGTNNGFLLVEASEGIDNALHSYSSREGANPPELVLDFGTSTAATVTSTAIMKSAGGTPGYIKAGGGYRVYANVSGSPLTSTANVDAITTGQTAVNLEEGSYSAGGVSYNYRSEMLTANAGLAAGAHSFTATADYSSLGGTVQALADATAPTAVNVDTTNKAGGIAGRPETGDTIYYDFSESVDPQSVLEGWTGGSTNVVVEVINNGLSDDTIYIRNASDTAPLPFGSVDTNGDPMTSTTKFGASGDPSTMVQSGTRITITLGTASGTGVRTDSKTTPMVWSPSDRISDLAGNPMSTATATETGALDIIF